MKYYSLLLLAFVFVISCKKENEFIPNPVPEPAPLSDFLYLPVKDAEWRVHLQNFEITDVPFCPEYAYINDTALHEYYTIKSTNTDTLIGKYQYWCYSVYQEINYTRQSCLYNRRYSWSGPFLLREDTAGKKVYALWDGVDFLVADFSTDEVGKEAKVSGMWPASQVIGENGILVNGQKAKSWEVAYSAEKNKKFFYKAYGIGNQAGMLPLHILDYCEPVSLDFTYKGQTNHFDFELHP